MARVEHHQSAVQTTKQSVTEVNFNSLDEHGHTSSIQDPRLPNAGGTLPSHAMIDTERDETDSVKRNLNMHRAFRTQDASNPPIQGTFVYQEQEPLENQVHPE